MSFCKLITLSPGERGQGEGFFERALYEAQKGIGFTHPNPPVGCVLVKNNQVIATGYHTKAGEPHAEVQALQVAGKHARDATLYVTLEPCNHFGRMPPCTQAIIEAGIAQVIYGALDPNPDVIGHGAQVLRKAGIEVKQVSNLEQKVWAEALIQPFKTLILQKRPYVLAKIATSLDGKIAFRSGQQTPITGPEVKLLTHRWREAFDVVGVGAKTFEVDKPQLTARFENRTARRQPERVVFYHNLTPQPPLQQLERGSEMLFPLSTGWRGVKGEVSEVLSALGDQGFTSLLLEGGGVLLTAFLKAGVVDEIAWFTAPKIIGQQGVPAVLDLENLLDYSKKLVQMQLGVDFLSILCQKNPHG